MVAASPADPLKSTTAANFPRPSAGTVVAVAAIAVVLSWGFSHVFAWLWKTWSTNPDYSHGFLVPLFSLALIWLRREHWTGPARSVSASAFAVGLVFLAFAAATQAAGVYMRMISLEAVSLPGYLAGAVLCGGGWRAAKVAWPAVFFLGFMFPIPVEFSGIMSGVLQRVATIASTFVLQLLGLPAIAEGNVIWLSEKPINVAEACSGIRMLVSFFALTVGACLVMHRPLWEKAVVVLSAPVIAVLANVMRITATGLAHEFGSKESAEQIHDLAGLLMMAFGLAFLFVELAILSRVFLPDEEQALRGLGFGSAGPAKQSG